MKSGEKVSFKSTAALSSPAVPMFALMMPLVIFVPPYYAEHMGLGMAAVGTIFMLGRLFDVLSDPFAGILMDRTRIRMPKRLWVVLGAAPLTLGTWKIFFAEPPGDPTVLMAWLVFLYVGWTLMSVGLFSWASEVSDDYHERSRVMGAVQMGNGVGTVIVLLIPVGIELVMPGEDVSSLRVQAMGGMILLLLPVTLLFAWFYGPKPVSSAQTSNAGVLLAFKHAISDISLRRLLIADLAVGVEIGVFTALTVFYAEIVLGLEGRAGLLQLALLVASLLGLPLFVHLAGRVEKHVALIIGAGFTAIGSVLAAILPADSLITTLCCYFLFGLAGGGNQMLPRAIMADVLDEAKLKTGEQKTGFYFSFLTTTFKLGLGLGVGLSYGIAGLAGFDPVIAREDASAHWIIRVLIGVFPVVMALLIAVVMWKFPLDRNRQQEVQAELLQRE